MVADETTTAPKIAAQSTYLTSSFSITATDDSLGERAMCPHLQWENRIRRRMIGIGMPISQSRMGI